MSTDAMTTPSPLSAEQFCARVQQCALLTEDLKAQLCANAAQLSAEKRQRIVQRIVRAEEEAADVTLRAIAQLAVRAPQAVLRGTASEAD